MSPGAQVSLLGLKVLRTALPTRSLSCNVISTAFLHCAHLLAHMPIQFGCYDAWEEPLWGSLMIRIVLPHLNQSGWVSDVSRPFIWAARRSWSTLSFFIQQARIMSAAVAVRLFIGCLPLWCWQFFALGGCCGLHSGPLATVVLVLSPVSCLFRHDVLQVLLCWVLGVFALVLFFPCS